jgi:hypothetical protein
MSRDRFLQAATSLIKETGEHPAIEEIDRRLASWQDETSARREAARLPRNLGAIKEGRVYLFVRGVEQAERGSAMLERFPAALREAREIYGNRDRRDPLISVADLIKQVGVSESVAWQVLRLLEAEKLARKVRTGVCEVLPHVRRYSSVRTVEDYLDRKREFERRSCRRRTFRKPLTLAAAGLKRESRTWAVVVGAAGILLAALVLWIGKELTTQNHGSPPRPRPHRSESKRPQTAGNHTAESRQDLRSEAARSGG